MKNIGGYTRGKQLSVEKAGRESEYNANPNRCTQCQVNLSYNKRKNKFCSRSCSVSYNNRKRTITTAQREQVSLKLKGRTRIERIIKQCMSCSVTFEVPCNSKRKYCTSRCYVSSEKGRQLASLGGRIGCAMTGRRSKNEKYFAELCKLHLPYDILENERMFNGWDADVIIPELRIAILWNGNWHRQKITKKHSPLQVQNRDRIKIKEILLKNYKPYVIEDYGKHNPPFVKKEFEKFMEYIKTFS